MASTVSAIVSSYNAEMWIAGRIDNLLEQTLHAQGRLEIVVVVAGSKQDEGRIVRDYWAAGAPITLLTTLREPIYTSWNRGIRVARGDYVTNANTDDRLAPDALERMADALDADPELDLVYADSYVTDTVNATWDNWHPSTAPPYTNARLTWPDYDPVRLLQFCYMGPCPMWRKALHTRVGLFDESYQLAGDYEMWLRAAAKGAKMRKLDAVLSLFYYGGSTHQNQALSDQEARRALLKWRSHIARH